MSNCNCAHFRLSAFLNSRQEVFHAARTTINSSYDLQLHDHDYAEVFWIKAGSGLHLINGEEVVLKKETMCMVRPCDRHTFKLDKKQDSLVITNIAFHQYSLNLFRHRYFLESECFFWVKGKLPFHIQLDIGQLNELSSLTDRLISQPRDHLHLDAAMIYIFKMLNAFDSTQVHIPHWLAYALDNYNTPNNFRKGVQGFVTLTERSTDHVNRILQKKLKQSLTQTVIKAKIKYATQQLIMTNSSIKSICFSCGFESISYFYRIFKKYTGQTPIEYRKRNHKIF